MKILFKLLGSVMFFFNRFVYKPWSKFWRLILDRKYTEMPEDLPWTQKQLRSFLEMCVWTEDPVGGSLDYFIKPERFYMTERGDCDDFSAFSANVLDSEYFSNILTIQWWVPGKGKHFHGHNVCVFLRGAKLYHIGNWGTHGPYSSLREIVDSIADTKRGNIVLSWGLRKKISHGLPAGYLK